MDQEVIVLLSWFATELSVQIFDFYILCRL